MLNVFSHPYKMDESFYNFRVVVWYFSFLFNFFFRNFRLQTVENLIRRLIWVCFVCGCLGLYGLNKLGKRDKM